METASVAWGRTVATSHFVALAGLASFGIATTACADATVRAIGRLECTQGGPNAMVGVRVELMDSDCRGSQVCDDVMVTDYVKADGSYSLEGRGGDMFGGDPDVYVRFTFNDDHGVRSSDEANVDRSESTEEHAHDDTPDGSTVDFGTLLVGVHLNAGDSPGCRIFQRVREEYRDFVDNVDPPNTPPAGHIDLLVWSSIWAGAPWTNTDTIHWPLKHHSGAERHEFGHSIRHAADGDGRHFMDDVVAYVWGRNHETFCEPNGHRYGGERFYSALAYNFNEGWADYWAGTGSSCPGLSIDWNEQQISARLSALQGAHMLTRKEMVDILRRHSGTIHTIDEFHDALTTDMSAGFLSLRTGHLPLDEWSRAHPFKEVRPTGSQAGYDDAQRSAVVSEALTSVRAAIAQRHQDARSITVAEREIRGRTCAGKDCEAVFNAIVSPILLEGEARTLAVYERMLVGAQSETWVKEMQARLKGGKFDVWFAEWRAQLQRDIQAEMLRAIDEAEAALAQARPRLSHAYELYARELADARNVVAPSGQGQRGKAIGGTERVWAPRIVWPDEQVQSKAP